MKISKKSDKEKDEADLLYKAIKDYEERKLVEIEEQDYWNLYFNESWKIEKVKMRDEKLYKGIFKCFKTNYTQKAEEENETVESNLKAFLKVLFECN